MTAVADLKTFAARLQVGTRLRCEGNTYATATRFDRTGHEYVIEERGRGADPRTFKLRETKGDDVGRPFWLDIPRTGKALVVVDGDRITYRLDAAKDAPHRLRGHTVTYLILPDEP